ncbi:class I SAM-dependent methyltransferase [Muricoccus radiodurans]|uniref:class I SAM-dependent methyltransferase n=1 Tax=Muricoccus radiodurans TaxID=2231721 RepID=UPI003CEAD956
MSASPDVTLVFPAGMAAARTLAAEAEARGGRVVGASSLPFDPARRRFPDWEHLPYHDAPDFPARLSATIRARGITRVATPHPVVHERLHDLLPRIAPGCALRAVAPYAAEVAGYRSLLRDAAFLTEDARLGRGTRQPPLGAEAAAALLRAAWAVPGMCDDEKIWALAAIARHAPPGDLVEIGSWWGKSALVLAWLAARHGIGDLLCVDPWTPEGTRQGVEELDTVSAAADHEEAMRIFRINLLSFGGRGVNTLRLSSVEGAAAYRASRVVESPAFGRTTYTGAISILHIDGNHAHEHVSADVASWLPLLRAGGWLVLDDYLWPFGDGPRRVGDALLSGRADDIRCAFTAGSALFICLGG